MHFLNTSFLIIVNDEGISMNFNDEHSLNNPLSNFTQDDGFSNVTFFNDEHFLKASDFIFITLFGIVISLSEEHSLNALLLIIVTLSGISI